jgi:D-alanyl-lipoteichoic acid acyltransferase DltB (MBOAT superfamily)
VQFDSFAYLGLVTAALIGFYALPSRLRPLVILLASAIFYGAWSVAFLGLIVVSATVDFSCGLALGRVPEARRRYVLLASVVTNLGILGYFKYANFFVDNVAGLLGAGPMANFVEVVLPPGISFYTFQTMSYTIDVYRRQIRPTKSFVDFLVYVSFFPQLVAGPIERASRLLPQLQAAFRSRFSVANFAAGIQLIIWGVFKKVVLADQCAALVEPVYGDPAAHGGWAALIATYAFTLQIYFDFSAYSEIARGSARLFGVQLMRNFDQPYLVGNVREFWRHWHISLSEWFRDYVYRPLGGNRLGRSRTLANLTATMFLSGLWHGAAWTFVAWGLYHGVLLLSHALLEGVAAYGRLRRRLGRVWGAVSIAVTFHLVVAGWVLFRAKTFGDAAVVASKIADAPGAGLPSGSQLAFLAAVAAFLGLSAWARRGRWRERIDQSPAASSVFYAAVLIATVVAGAESGPQFIYFQF